MITDNVINADNKLQQWIKTGQKIAQRKPGFIHDLDAVADMINDLTDYEKEVILSQMAVDILREDVPTIPVRSSDRRTYCTLMTYLIEMVRAKYGDNAIDTEDGWRAFAARGEVIVYVRQLLRITLDRIMIRATQ